MLRTLTLSFAILVCLASAALATPNIVLTNYIMPAGTTGNAIDVFVTGGDAVQGLGFIIDSNDNQPGGPIITAVDIVGPDTIFFGNNTGQGGSPPPPATKVKQTTTTASGTVSANGVLGHVTFSTVGVLAGVYDLRMTGMATAGGGSRTDFAGIAPTITNGTITVVPEPSSVVLGLFSLAGLSAIAIRKRRARRTA